MSNPVRLSYDLIATVNLLVHTSRRMLQELGREPTAEELAQRLALPLEQVRRLMAIAGLPIRLVAA
jgi:RNA polymerase primary sigma factor